MLYTLDRVTCEETIVDTFILWVSGGRRGGGASRAHHWSQVILTAPAFLVASPLLSRSGPTTPQVIVYLPVHM